MVQQLRTLAAPADLSSVPSTHVTVPGDPMPSFGHRHQDTRYTYLQSRKDTHNRKIKP